MTTTTPLKQRLPLKIHRKKMGQLQFYFSPPVLDTEGYLKEGALYLEAARSLEGGDGNQCDWPNKLVFKLSAHELSEIIVRVRKGMFPVDLVHKHNNETASLKVEPGTVGKDGFQTFGWTLNKNGGFVRVYCNEPDMHLLFTAFEAAIPALLGWVWRDTARLAVESLQPQEAAPRASSRRDDPPPPPEEYGYGRR
jgi:hypothetical protein